MDGTPCFPVSQPRVSFRDGLPLQVQSWVSRFPISLFFGGMLSFCFLLASPAVAQQNIISKSCTSCGREVPLSSSVGDYCPHCGVRWGGEAETTTPRQPHSGVQNTPVPDDGKMDFGEGVGWMCTAMTIGLVVLLLVLRITGTKIEMRV